MLNAAYLLKIRPLFSGLLLGVVFTSCLGFFALKARDSRWEIDAWNHYAAVYVMDYKNPHPKAKWMWFDDYAKMRLAQLKEQLHATPTPLERL